MGEVIVITSGKGGVGKTTTTANLGTGFALQGKKTVRLAFKASSRTKRAVATKEKK